MNDENLAGALSAEEEAYFASGGEKDIGDPQPDPGKEEPKPGKEGEGDGGKEKVVAEDANARDEKGRFVPHQALHAEREEHKRTKAELAELKTFRAVMEDRWQGLMKATEQPEQKPEEPPDPDKDIFAYSRWQAGQIQKLQTEFQQNQQQTQQAKQEQEQEQQVWGYWQADSSAYAQQNPEFGQAAQWLAETRGKQLEALGSLDPRFNSKQGRDAQINSELKDIIIRAAQVQMSPAEYVFNLAKSYGFNAQPAQTQQPSPQSLALPENLRKVAEAQDASRTVGQVNGRSGGDEISPEVLAAMPLKEFEAWAAQPGNKRKLDLLMGA